MEGKSGGKLKNRKGGGEMTLKTGTGKKAKAKTVEKF